MKLIKYQNLICNPFEIIEMNFEKAAMDEIFQSSI